MSGENVRGEPAEKRESGEARSAHHQIMPHSIGPQLRQPTFVLPSKAVLSEFPMAAASKGSQS